MNNKIPFSCCTLPRFRAGKALSKAFVGREVVNLAKYLFFLQVWLGVYTTSASLRFLILRGNFQYFGAVFGEFGFAEAFDLE